MKLKHVKAVVQDLMPRIREALNLEDWDLLVTYADHDEPVESDGHTRFVRSAQVRIKGEYLHACITVFCANITDEAHLRQTLVHECVHVTQWMFWQYSNVIGNLLPEDRREADEAAWTHAVERHVQEVLRWPHIKALAALPEVPVPRGTAGPGGKGQGGKRRGSTVQP